MALLIAGGRLDTLGAINRQLYGDKSHDAFAARLMYNNIVIKERNGVKEVDLSDEALRAIAKEAGKIDPKVSPRTNCPALFVEGDKSANVITDYVAWAVALLRKYYLPTLERDV
jgi:hypothetical protein